MASLRRSSVWGVCAAVAVAGSVLSLVWTDSASTQGVPNIPGWRCYAAKTAKGTKFTPIDVTWNGSLEVSTTTVLKPIAYCDRVNGGDINNTAVALACYKTKDVKGTEKFSGRQINISSAPFGHETLDLKKSNTVCIEVTPDS